MKITIEENREAIKRYRHIKPAPTRGSALCSVRCPGTVRTCTLKKGHAGFHVAHGPFKKVVAVWDQGIRAGKHDDWAEKKALEISNKRLQDPGMMEAWKSTWGSIIQRSPSMEEMFLLVLSVAMVGFAVHWLFQIFAGG